ncbi:hypothetical protein E2C01_043608 [Portunus trituberculatus]|uniref:Uncharacterized protein n=1 Tax=Portunus trituberculatus TaxID=210409 RepID=A0A5B7G014_PORTR|nr:hypothetical protein [Portunus trituberculatus]
MRSDPHWYSEIFLDSFIPSRVFQQFPGLTHLYYPRFPHLFNPFQTLPRPFQSLPVLVSLQSSLHLPVHDFYTSSMPSRHSHFPSSLSQLSYPFQPSPLPPIHDFYTSPMPSRHSHGPPSLSQFSYPF